MSKMQKDFTTTNNPVTPTTNHVYHSSTTFEKLREMHIQQITKLMDETITEMGKLNKKISEINLLSSNDGFLKTDKIWKSFYDPEFIEQLKLQQLQQQQQQIQLQQHLQTPLQQRTQSGSQVSQNTDYAPTDADEDVPQNDEYSDKDDDDVTMDNGVIDDIDDLQDTSNQTSFKFDGRMSGGV